MACSKVFASVTKREGKDKGGCHATYYVKRGLHHRPKISLGPESRGQVFEGTHFFWPLLVVTSSHFKCLYSLDS